MARLHSGIEVQLLLDETREFVTRFVRMRQMKGRFIAEQANINIGPGVIEKRGSNRDQCISLCQIFPCRGFEIAPRSIENK